MRSILFISVLLITAPIFCMATDEDISGSINKGYRILTVDATSTANHLTVYRGDYIKLSYPARFGTLDFSMPELQYTGTLFPEPAASSYFKMKTAGTSSFTLGQAGGTIRVIELIRSNYIEVTADEAAELLTNLQPFILDVRTPQEYKRIHIKGSHLIPIQQLQQRIEELESQKHADIFVYCATGNRSTVASRILVDRGFKRIYNLRKGVHDWARNGHPYISGK